LRYIVVGYILLTPAAEVLDMHVYDASGPAFEREKMTTTYYEKAYTTGYDST
jgi:hypothetical protein